MEKYFKLNKRLIDYLNFGSLRNFLRPIRSLQSSGLKHELIARIEEAINNGNLPKEAFYDYLAHELRYGQNRSLFITRINSASLHKVKDILRLKAALQTAGLKDEEFSDYVDSFPTSEDPELVHLEIERDGAEVKKIILCFSNLIMVNRITEDGMVSVEDTDYVWITIDIVNEQLLIAVRPRGNLNDTSSRTVAIYNYFTHYLTDVFSLKYFSNDEMKYTLYNIFKELTTKAERPYVEKVEPYLPQIEEFCHQVAAGIGLPSSVAPVNLPFRIKRLLERALIQNDFFNFKAYSKGKIGTVERFFYADETGAKVNATANDGDGIELNDIYFDTRDTIDDQRMFKKLWVKWFLPNENEIDTKLEVTSSYFLVHINRYHSGDEQNYVLSTIEAFKSVSD